MILGIGNDIVQIERIEKAIDRSGQKFKDRCFTPHEQAKAEKRKSSISSVYAKRFAAKEACAKALGTGFADGIIMRDIGVVEDDYGRPLLELSGGAEKRLKAITPEGMVAVLHLSLADDPPVAQAFVVIEARPQK